MALLLRVKLMESEAFEWMEMMLLLFIMQLLQLEKWR